MSNFSVDTCVSRPRLILATEASKARNLDQQDVLGLLAAVPTCHSQSIETTVQ
jgi:hypothetical protein